MPTLQTALATYLQIDRRPTTTKQYTLILNKLVAAIGPARDIRRVSYEDLLDYFAQLRTEGLKSSTLHGYGQITKSFFSWCVKRKYIKESPAADLFIRQEPRDPTKRRDIPTGDLNAIVEYARVTSPRNFALLLFIADTGCRAGGAASLQTDHLFLCDHYAEILEKGGFWKRVRFGEDTAAALSRWLELRPPANHTYVWTGKGPNFAPLKAASISAVIASIAEDVGASRKWRAHSIRHAVGHALAFSHVPVTLTQRKLNHANPATTAKYYYPDSDADLEVISEKLALAPLKRRRDA